MANKGKISNILNDGKAVMVKPYTGAAVTPPLVVPFFLFGGLSVGMAVVYESFEDGTGIVLARMDGEFNRNIPGNVTISGTVTASDFSTNTASFNSHIHTCPDGQTSTPK